MPVDAEKLEQLKKNVESFQQMFGTIAELIQSLEEAEDMSGMKEEAYDALSTAKDGLEEISSSLDDAESSINSAKSSADDLIRDIRHLMEALS